MSGSHGPDIVTDNLSLYIDAANSKSYPGTGTTWYDLTTNSYDYTLYNTPVFNSAGYFNFNGTDQYASGTHLSYGVSWPTGVRTIEMVFRLLTIDDSQYTYGGLYGDQIGTSQVLFAYDGPAPVSLGWNTDDSRYDASHKSTIQLNTGQWVHFVVVLEDGGHYMTYYANGDLDKDRFVSADVNGEGDTNIWSIARQNRNQGSGEYMYTHCDVALIRQYEAILTFTQINQNYNSLKGRFGL